MYFRPGNIRSGLGSPSSAKDVEHRGISAARSYERALWPSLAQAVEGDETSVEQPTRMRPILGGREIIADEPEVAQAVSQCQQYSGDDIISCFPTKDTVVFQNEYASFVWNSCGPELGKTNEVDIYLFHADSGRQVLQITNQTNHPGQAGLIHQPVNDSWFGQDGLKWDGQNISYPFYWVIVRSDEGVDGKQIPQPTFTAVQTTFLSSVSTSQPCPTKTSGVIHSTGVAGHPSAISPTSLVQSNKADSARTVATTSPGALQPSGTSRSPSATNSAGTFQSNGTSRSSSITISPGPFQPNGTSRSPFATTSPGPFQSPGTPAPPFATNPPGPAQSHGHDSHDPFSTNTLGPVQSNGPNSGAPSATSSSSPADQCNGAGLGAPHWAIAVISILGSLLMIALCALGLLAYRLRKRNHRSNRNTGEGRDGRHNHHNHRHNGNHNNNGDWENPNDPDDTNNDGDPDNDHNNCGCGSHRRDWSGYPGFIGYKSTEDNRGASQSMERGSGEGLEHSKHCPVLVQQLEKEKAAAVQRTKELQLEVEVQREEIESLKALLKESNDREENERERRERVEREYEALHADLNHRLEHGHKGSRSRHKEGS